MRRYFILSASISSSYRDGKIEVPCTCSILVRKEAIMNVGGFKESFRGMFEDQAFYAKMFLAMPVLSTSDCLAWYRQHPESHTLISEQSNPSGVTHYIFLKWLETYCCNIGINDTRILHSVRREIWLNHNPSLEHFPYQTQNVVRRIK